MVAGFSNDRYKLVKKIQDVLPSIKCEIVLVMGATNLRGKLKYLFNNLKRHDINIFLKPISTSQVINILKSSKIVLDVPHKLQSGLTIRTFEAMALKKKIITTNITIRKYDFYKPENIFIIEDESLKGLKDFLSLEYVELDSKILNKYSVETWLKSFFNGKKMNYLNDELK